MSSPVLPGVPEGSPSASFSTLPPSALPQAAVPAPEAGAPPALAWRALLGRVVHLIRRIRVRPGGPQPSPARPNTRRVMPRVARWAALALLVLAGFAAALAALVLQALRPGPGDWSYTLRVPLFAGTLEREVSVPVLLRWATHPLAGVLLEGRRLHTPAGRWRLHYAANGDIEGDCAPCTLRLAALGPAPVSITHARLQLKRQSPEQWQGVLRLGDGASSLAMTWRAQLREQALEIRAELPTSPVADAVALFGDAVPEARVARIDGQLGFRLEAAWGPQGLSVTRMVPRLDGVQVSGLGTEALADAEPPAHCAAPRGGRLEGWLPHAVVAAEDQRFYEHVGYDLQEWVAAWHRNPGRQARPEGGTPHGASTLTQQLAKLLYTGDERSATRKLREWLYAVEMERTLGKGRILQTYLAVAPWGNGLCGAEAASRHYLRKPAHRLAPHEAAWLASLLTSPDAQAGRWARLPPADADTQRVARIVNDMRRLPRERKAQEVALLAGWSPLQQPRPRAMQTPSAAGGMPVIGKDAAVKGAAGGIAAPLPTADSPMP
jgi:hypothetical protein